VSIAEYAEDKECREISGVESEQGFADLVGFPTVEA